MKLTVNRALLASFFLFPSSSVFSQDATCSIKDIELKVSVCTYFQRKKLNFYNCAVELSGKAKAPAIYFGRQENSNVNLIDRNNTGHNFNAISVEGGGNIAGRAKVLVTASGKTTSLNIFFHETKVSDLKSSKFFSDKGVAQIKSLRYEGQTKDGKKLTCNAIIKKKSVAAS